MAVAHRRLRGWRSLRTWDPGSVPGGAALDPFPEAEQLGSGLVGVEGGILEGDPDPEPDPAGLGGHVIAGDPDLAPGGGEQGARHLHRRRLARPVRAQEPVDLPGGYPEVDAVDGSDPVEVPHQSLGVNRLARERFVRRHRGPVRTPVR